MFTFRHYYKAQEKEASKYYRRIFRRMISHLNFLSIVHLFKKASQTLIKNVWEVQMTIMSFLPWIRDLTNISVSAGAFKFLHH